MSITNNALTKELYKFTNEYRRNAFISSSLYHRYIFKPYSPDKTEEPEGSFNFIDSNKLYDYDDNNLKDAPDIRTYFKYNTIKGRFLNKNLRVCDLPVGILERGGCPICRISSNVTKKDSTDLIYPGLKNTPIPEAYGYKMSSEKFFNATGVKILVYGIKDNCVHEVTDINIMLMSSNYFDISFIDDELSEYYMIEINKTYTDFENISDKYRKTISCSGISVDNDLRINISDDNNNFIKSYYVDNSQLWIKITISNNSYLIPHDKIKSVTSTQISVDKSCIGDISDNDTINIEIYLYTIEDDNSPKEDNINDILGGNKVLEPSTESESYDDNIRKYYPYYFRKYLESDTDLLHSTYYEKIDTVDMNGVIYLPNNDKYIPCIQLEIPIKHSSIMIFQNGKIVSPYAYFEGQHTIIVYDKNGNKYNKTYGSSGNMYLYIDISNLDEDQYKSAVRNADSEYKLTNPIYMIISNTFFNENVVFPLTAVDKYLKFEDNRYIYNYSSNTYEKKLDGDYLKDENERYYKIIANEDGSISRYTQKYEQITTGGKTIYQLQYTSDNDGEYYKVQTNEYVLPVNKNIDINNLSIAIETMEECIAEPETDGNYTYAKDPGTDKFVNLYWKVIDSNGVSHFYLKDFTTLSEGEPFSENNYFYKIGTYKENEYKIVTNSEGTPIVYRRVSYKCSNVTNNLKYYTEPGDLGLYELNDNNEYIKYKPDEKLIKSLKSYNKVIKFRIENGEIIDCGYPNTDEFLTLIDLQELYESEEDHSNPKSLDLNSNLTTILDGFVFAYNTNNGYSKYYLNDEDENFLSYEIPNQLMMSDKKLLAFMDGYFTDEFRIDKHLYYRLFHGDTILSFSTDQTNPDIGYTYDPNGDYVYDTNEGKYRKYNESSDSELTRYKKHVASIYLTNPGNYTLYQDIHGISYDDGVFTLANDIDGCVIDQQQMYTDFYMVPYSTKYMLLFINGKYIDHDHIEVISNRRFALKNLDYYNFNKNDDGNIIINEMFIYRFDYLNPEKYMDYYEEPTVLDDCKIYGIKDELWDNYKDDIKLDDIYKDIVIYPKDTGFNPDTSKFALYETFGKYVLNKYDLESDFILADEVKSYFNELYDSDGRMPLRFNIDSDKRKYVY